MKNIFNVFFLFPIIFAIFVSIFFVPTITIGTSPSNLSTSSVLSTSSTFLWPTPGYSKITSKFGYRKAPTKGAGTYHGGIDIGAPENASIVSIADGVVSFVGWNGATGYTVMVKHSNGYKSTYGHISPNFIVSVGDNVSKGQLIAKIGPKYVNKKSYTNYKDKTGKYTNGATTRSPFTFCNYERLCQT